MLDTAKSGDEHAPPRGQVALAIHIPDGRAGWRNEGEREGERSLYKGAACLMATEVRVE